MKNDLKTETRGSLLFCIFALALVTAVIALPAAFRSSAAGSGEGLFPVTRSDEGIPDYDIRVERDEKNILVGFRRQAGTDAVAIADMRQEFVRAERDLRTRVKSLAVDYNPTLRTPEVIGPNMKEGINYLTAPSGTKRLDILRGFAKQNQGLIGVTPGEIDGLKVAADYTNPSGNMSFVNLDQYIGDIPVFRGELKAGFSQDNRMMRVINNLAPGLDGANISSDFRDPVDAVRAAARYADHELRDSDVRRNDAGSTDMKVVFGDGPYATSAWKYYFPTEPGVARASWLVTIWKDVAAYEVMVDAETGTMLWRHNMVKDQTEPVTYNVWSNTTSGVRSLDSPAPLTPGPIDPSLGTQGTVQPRTMITLIGNEPPNTFNNNGWMNDGTNVLEGNNTLAGLDRGSPNGADTPLIAGSGNRIFDFPTIVPPDPIPGGTDYPLPAGEVTNPCPATPNATILDSQKAAVTQMFYVVNRFHDVLYLHGFTEQARNFQLDNFGRGGIANDRVLAEGQDCSGVNNANFASSTTDGTVGRMQMFLWNPATPDRDGTFDAEVILHEIGHGITNRLHTAGISGTQGGQMHEGNGDFLGHMLLSETTDPINGTYTTGGYVTLNLRAGPPFSNVGNYYYGIRRFPKAVIAFTGGPLNRPHNPLTYADIDPAQLNTTDGAFAPAFPGSATAVHDGGEIWSSMLWEVRSRLVTRLGHTAGTSKMLQLQLDGMKLAPAAPTMLTERNAILTAAAALPGGASADVADVWAGFAARGLGFLASNPAGNTVVEDFGLPNAVVTDPFSIDDSAGDGDGFPEPGESLLLSIAVVNNSGGTVTNVEVSVVGGGTVNYGTIADGATVTNDVPYTVPGDAECGSLHTVTINLTSSVGTNPPQTRSFRLGEPVGGPPISFSNTTPITIPSSGPATPYPSVISVSGVSGARAVKIKLEDANSAFPDDVDFLVEGPGGQTFIFLSDAGGTNDWVDTDVTLTDLADSLASDSGAIPEGEYKPTNYGANDPFDAPAPPGPHANPATAGTDTFESVYGTNGSTMNGDWKLYIDDDLAGFAGSLDGGWTITFESVEYNCSPGGGGSARGDFDDDGRTDIAVWRPSDGNWHISQSTDGYVAYAWGASGDQIVTGTYDGDGKADVAVYRQSTGTWFILNSSDGTYSTYSWGGGADVAVPGDYDDDGRTDVAVRRPSTGEYFILKSSGGTQTSTWGNSTDTPVVGDFDGDGQTDLAVWRSSTGEWFINRSTAGTVTVTWGAAGDRVVHADYDGDGKDDVAVWRGSTGTWFILNSNGGTSTYTWGAAGDVPVPGNYDGDARDDIGVFRNGVWHIDRTTGGYLTASWGIGTDIAVPAEYIP